MNVRKFLLFCLILLAILIGALISTKRTVNAQGKECIQLFVGGGIVEHVVTVNTQTYTPVVESELTIPPTAYFSPDRKYAVFWQEQDNELGFYISSTEKKNPVLLQKTKPDRFKSDKDYTDIDGAHFRSEFQAWSPDSSKLAYVDKDKGKYFIIIVNVDGTDNQTKRIASPELKHPLQDAGILGWSADSKYIAAYVEFDSETTDFFAEQIDFHIWTADLKEIETDIVPSADYTGKVRAKWSRTGHRLAVQLFTVPEFREYDNRYGTKLAIWSPEHGIEADNFAQASDTFGDEYHTIYWSPDETHLRMRMAWDHDSNDLVFGINGKRIVASPEQMERFNPASFERATDFVGWAANGFALMLDTNILDTKNEDDEYEETTELYLVNVNKGSRIMLERDALEPRISNDGNYVAFKDNSEAVKLIDLRTYKETSFKGGTGMAWWSPDNKYVEFGSFSNPIDFTEFLIDVNKLQKIDLKAGSMRWLTDEWIIYLVQRNDQTHLEVRNVKSNVTYDLGETEYDMSERAIVTYSLSPDKRYIAALLNKETVTILSLEDGKQTNQETAVNFWQTPSFLNGAYTTHDLTEYRLPNYDLAWSPDSAKLAFVEKFGQQTNLMVLDQAGKEIQKVLLPDAIPHDFSGYVTWATCD